MNQVPMDLGRVAGSTYVMQEVTAAAENIGARGEFTKYCAAKLILIASERNTKW
jgi:hypothetical protein